MKNGLVSASNPMGCSFATSAPITHKHFTNIHIYINQNSHQFISTTHNKFQSVKADNCVYITP